LDHKSQRTKAASHRNQRGSFHVLMIHYRNLSVSRKAIAKSSGRALMHPSHSDKQPEILCK